MDASAGPQLNPYDVLRIARKTLKSIGERILTDRLYIEDVGTINWLIQVIDDQLGEK